MKMRRVLMDAGIEASPAQPVYRQSYRAGTLSQAMHVGPLWQPLYYAQFGDLTFATFVTLLLVPERYSIFVLDLKIAE